MRRNTSLLLLLIVLGGFSFSQAQKIRWQTCMGGLGYDNGMKMIPIENGCFLMGGVTSSTTDIGKGNHSNDYDIVVAKVSAEGGIIWSQCIGGSGKEEFGQMQQTADGGLIVIGTTKSTDGHASDGHGKKDILLTKVDALGRIEWNKCYGGHGNDRGLAVIQTAEGGYLIGGESGSNTGNMTEHRGGLDGWVAKLDAYGMVEKEKSLGGRGNEAVHLLSEIEPGRYLVITTTTSTDGDIKDPLGAKDVWMACLSKNFDFVWTRSYGGSDFDDIHGLYRNHRGEYLLAGTTFSEDGDLDLTTNHGLGDSWLFQITSDGNLAWSQTYGGAKSEGGNAVTQCPDRGYLLVGTSNSKDKLVPVNKGLYDGWIVRTDSLGRKLWSCTFGGEDFEYLYDAIAIDDGNYMALGFAESVKGDLIELDKEIGNDFWFFRFSDPDSPEGKFPVSSNYLSGFVASATTNIPLRSEVILTDNETLKEIKTYKSSKDNGIYNMPLAKKGNYSVMITSPGYMFYGQDIDYSLFTGNPEMRIDAFLLPIIIGTKVALRNIYFDTGKTVLKDESTPELNRLLKFMQLNPNVKVEISGHTDGTGNVDTKKALSLRRATRVRDWLLKKGVSGRNMQVAGYGMDRPVAEEDTPEGRAKNRRVEVEIVEIF